jgi:hypothetical protein
MRNAMIWLMMLFTLATCAATAQEKEAPKSPQNEAARHLDERNFYRLDFTIREIQDKKTIATRSYSMLLADDGAPARLKAGARLPVATGSFSTTNATLVNTQFQYLDVGVNLQCRIRDAQPYPLLSTTIDFSGPALPEQQAETPGGASLAKGQPVIRQAVSDVTVPLQVGKAMLISSMDDPSMPRRFEIEVTPTKLK